MISDLVILQNAFKLVTTINKLSDSKFIDVMNDIADNNQKTGLRVLKENMIKVKDLDKKEDLVKQAIVHFDASIENYLSPLEKVKENFFIRIFNPPNQKRIYDGCFVSAMLIALCYRCLGWRELEKSYYLKGRDFFYKSIHYSFHNVEHDLLTYRSVTSAYETNEDAEWAYENRVCYQPWLLTKKDFKEINKMKRIDVFPFFVGKKGKKKLYERGEKVAKIINQRIVDIEKTFVNFSNTEFNIPKWSIPTFSVDHLLVRVSGYRGIDENRSADMQCLIYMNKWNPPLESRIE